MRDPAFLDPAADDQKLLAQVIGYYHATLKQSPEALEHLRSRGVVSSQAVEQFRIGYADRTLGKLLPTNDSYAGRAIRGKLQQLGIFRESGHDHFNGCVVFPIMAGDGTGRIVDVYGRKILGTKLRKGTPLDMYLGPERHGVWNVEALAATEEVIVCPSLFDALVFWCHGYRNVTCTLGPDALTVDHLAAFAEFRIKRALVVAEQIATRLLEAGLDCFHVRLPTGQSVESYAMQMDQPAEALGALVRRAEWLGNGKPPALAMPAAAPDTAQPVDGPDEGISADPPEANPLRTDSPLPPAPAPQIEAEVKDDEVVLTFGNRRYRVRGWTKNRSFDLLRVNLLAGNDSGMFVDTLDLYSAKYRRAFVVQASQELQVEEQTIKKDLGQVLLKLEELQDQHISQAPG